MRSAKAALVAPASEHLAALEPAIDRVIPFAISPKVYCKIIGPTQGAEQQPTTWAARMRPFSIGPVRKLAVDPLVSFQPWSWAFRRSPDACIIHLGQGFVCRCGDAAPNCP